MRNPRSVQRNVQRGFRLHSRTADSEASVPIELMIKSANGGAVFCSAAFMTSLATGTFATFVLLV